MSFAADAQRLVAEARAMPGFPFLDWPSNPQNLLSLMSTWDGIFDTAAGPLARSFHAVQDTGQSPDSPILFIRNEGQLRGFRIWAPTQDAPDDVAFFFGQILNPDEDSFADGAVHTNTFRCELEIACDLSEARVAAAMDMIARFLNTPITGPGDLEQLDSAFDVEYGGLFPRAPMPVEDEPDEDQPDLS